ncbi:hypothetical protein DL764_010175 [Monosporascus ibericus]|uniref:Uncharacterized protein n=1 Tax=Monosporascus ibericus TaxID=155417 RepID=A0A4Q4ST68_9PEZI|nr:hypothetical protein DL764_010175 [Monosporascus ibericus]
MSTTSRWKDRIYESIGLKEWKYDPLNQGDDPDRQDHQQQPRNDASPVTPWLRSKVWKVGAAVFVVFLFLVLVFRPSSTEISNLIFNPEIRSSYFYLVLPAATGSPEFCKTLFSASVLGYPTARIVNWKKTFDNSDLPHGGHDLAKVQGIHDFLKQLGSSTDNDLILIADGYDTWFQLRPSVLIDRYYAINDRVNKRLYRELGSKAGISQRVIFSAQKRCSSDNLDDLECDAIPESGLPDDVYGPRTDKNGDGFGTNRQRYLNAGTIMGHIGDVRKIFEAAVEIAKENQFKTDTEIFARIFGKQEYQRELIRLRHRDLSQKSWFSRLNPRGDITSPHPKRERPAMGPPPDYGIGLDYYGEISQPAEYDEGDVAWVAHNSSQKIGKMAQRTGIPTDVPEEVQRSTPPFWTPDYTGFVQAPAEQDWSQVPLFTNLWTGVTPVAVRQSPAEGSKTNPVVSQTWNQSWFFPYLRQMLVAHSKAPRMPHAVVQGIDGRTEEWWGPNDGRGGVFIETGSLPGEWQFWHGVCGAEDVAKEALADGRGPWRNPRWMLDHNNDVAADQLKDWYTQLYAVEDGTTVWGEKPPE